jgi:conjugative relaxase-like TrwC/TraI family protein
MLSIGKLGVGQERYYLGKVAEGAEDYYSGEGEAEGNWLGDGAELLGLDGKVEADQLVAMLTGRNPVDGELLGLKSAPGREPVPGFDLTFSAPKSVSLTWALGGHPVSSQVAEAHRAAVAEALKYLEANACWARRGRGGAEFVRGAGFTAAAYPHRSSRAGDPQLHTHVLIANATLGPDGRWSRLYHPALYKHAKTASYIYEAHLRHELTRRLGVEWQPVRKGIADVKGFTDEQIRHFSTRRQEILEAAGEGASARAMQIATLATRSAKDHDLTDASLRETWRVKALEVGLDREEIAGFLGHEQPRHKLLTVREVERSVTAHASHFDRRDAIQAVADNLPHGAPGHEVEQLADAFLAADSVIQISEGPRGPRFTTERIWKLERRALAVAAEMADAGDRAIAGEIVAARVIAARPSLKADQRRMVERLLTSGEGLVVVIGEAGTGKTYAVTAAASGWAKAGDELRVAAPTWRAANVLRSEGLDATSVARLLVELDHAADQGRLALRQGSVLLVDEAGMVDSATLARLIDHAQAAEVKLVLIGDPAQLGEIEAGGLFAAIAQRHEAIVLDEVIRHRHELDREAAKLIREGEGAAALAAYRDNERVTIATDRDGLREQMVSDWLRSHREGEDALMIAKRNSEVAELNVRAREALKAEGRLGGVEIEVGGERFAAGDQVITRVNDHAAQIYNRERWRVAEVDVEAQAVVLDGIDTRRRVCVDSVYLREVKRDGSPALQHGYAATTYQAQGATVDRAFVMADPSMDRQEFYVAASRSREESYFYASPEISLDREEFAPASRAPAEGLDHIAAAAERDGAQLAAHDEALRSRFSPLSTQDLHRLRRESAAEGHAEVQVERSRDELTERIADQDRLLESTIEQTERLPRLSREWRERERARIADLADSSAERANRLEAEREALPAPEFGGRAEVAVIDHLIAEREHAALLAAQIAPPPYITAELGERPTEWGKRREWDGAVREIESYRQQHGIRDRDTAFGPEPKDESAQREQRWARGSLQRSQRQLGIAQERTRAIERSRSLGIEM